MPNDDLKQRKKFMDEVMGKKKSRLYLLCELQLMAVIFKLSFPS